MGLLYEAAAVHLVQRRSCKEIRVYVDHDMKKIDTLISSIPHTQVGRSALETTDSALHPLIYER